MLQRSCLVPTRIGQYEFLDSEDESDVELQWAIDDRMVRMITGMGMLRVQAALNALYSSASEPPRKRRKLDRAYLQRATAVGDIGHVAPNTPLTIGGLAHNVANWDASPVHDVNKQPEQRYHYNQGPNQTATHAKLVRSYRRQGSGVGAKRPDRWWEFLALLGPQGRRKWVQGHFINARLGGMGRHKNLAPFTYSMNSTHYHEVEKHVISAIASGELVDYSVSAVPGMPNSANASDAVIWHRNFVNGNFVAAIGALNGVGALDATDAANVLAAGAGAALAVPTPNSWGNNTFVDVLDEVEGWIDDYILDTFPAGIVCRVRYYDAAGAKDVGEVMIDNTR
jgi:hypothetical protein